MHVHGGDLQHPAADGGESLLTHRERESEREREGGGRQEREGEDGGEVGDSDGEAESFVLALLW